MPPPTSDRRPPARAECPDAHGLVIACGVTPTSSATWLGLKPVVVRIWSVVHTLVNARLGSSGPVHSTPPLGERLNVGSA